MPCTFVHKIWTIYFCIYVNWYILTVFFLHNIIGISFTNIKDSLPNNGAAVWTPSVKNPQRPYNQLKRGAQGSLLAYQGHPRTTGGIVTPGTLFVYIWFANEQELRCKGDKIEIWFLVCCIPYWFIQTVWILISPTNHLLMEWFFILSWININCLRFKIV